jgi:hypothetical protein
MLSDGDRIGAHPFSRDLMASSVLSSLVTQFNEARQFLVGTSLKTCPHFVLVDKPERTSNGWQLALQYSAVLHRATVP